MKHRPHLLRKRVVPAHHAALLLFPPPPMCSGWLLLVPLPEAPDLVPPSVPSQLPVPQVNLVLPSAPSQLPVPQMRFLAPVQRPSSPLVAETGLQPGCWQSSSLPPRAAASAPTTHREASRKATVTELHGARKTPQAPGRKAMWVLGPGPKTQAQGCSGGGGSAAEERFCRDLGSPAGGPRSLTGAMHSGPWKEGLPI